MVDYLDPEIANEGISADAWTPVVAEARVPDYRGIKSIAKYFPQFTGRPYEHKTFQCFLYHPSGKTALIKDRYSAPGMDGEPTKLIKSAREQAEELGCVYRQSTGDELGQGFPSHRWVYTGEWRAQPFEIHKKFKPSEAGMGKTVVTPQSNGGGASAETIAAVVAAVLAKTGNGQDQAPISADPDYAEFVAFKAWKATQSGVVEHPRDPAPENALSSGAQKTETARKADLLEEAKRLGVTVDGRWGIDRIIAELGGAAS